jgi:FkbM family methyltransferase
MKKTINNILVKLGILQPRRQRGIIPKHIIKQYLPRNPVILEIGAHTGSDTVKFSAMYPHGKIYSFEPSPKVYPQLVENTKALKNVKCFQLALSDENGTSEFYMSSGDMPSSSSLRKPKEMAIYHPAISFDEKVLVQCSTLDAWCKQEKIEKVDFIWIDVQGHELSVFKGGMEVLKTVKAIHAEVNLKELYEGVPLYPELREWLKIHGFEVAVEALDWEDAGNVLFVRK